MTAATSGRSPSGWPLWSGAGGEWATFVAIATTLVLVTFDGALAAPLWYAAALLLLGVLALLFLRPPPGAWGGRAGRVALTAYAVLCAWSYLSIAWSDAPGDALEGANRTLLYGLALAIVAARPRSTRRCSLIVGTLGLGVAAVAAGVLVLAAVPPDPTWLLVEGRLTAPTGYANATASLWLIGFWPVVHVATSERWPWALRGIATAAACLLLQLGLLAQSRGAVIAFAATAVLYLALTRRRWAAVATTGVALVAVAASWGPLSAVQRAASPFNLSVAANRMAATALTGLVVGSVAALFGRRLLNRLPTRRLDRLARYSAAVALIAALVVGAALIGSPSRWLDARWSDFRTLGYQPAETGGSRLVGSLSSNRYDFYRVAFADFRRAPVTGIGLGGFMGRYLLQRRTDEAPRFSHSIVTSVASELGLVGGVLLALTLAGFSVAGSMARSHTSPGTGLAAGTAGAVAWFTHSLGDYLWEVPALAVLAFSLLGVVLSFRSQSEESDTGDGAAPEHPPGLLRWRALGVAVVAAPAAALLVAAGGASALTESGYATAATVPGDALTRFERAATLNPLAAEPLLAKGIVARDRDDAVQAEDALTRAVNREPRNWLIHFELGLLASERGRVREARREFDVAADLNPRLELTRRLREQSAAGRRIDVEAAEDPLTYFPARANSPVLERLAEEREHKTAWPQASGGRDRDH